MLTNFLDDLRFFRPSVELTKRIVNAIHDAHSADLNRVRADERQIEQDEDDIPEDPANEVRSYSSSTQAELDDETRLQQRRIASELFSLLVFQAESPQAKANYAVPIHDSVISGMSVSLGLSQQSSLLSQLAREFSSWLEEQGEFMAGWGRVIYADSDRMYLEEFPVDDIEADESTKDYASSLF